MNFSIVHFKKWRLLPGRIIRISECHDSVNVILRIEATKNLTPYVTKFEILRSLRSFRLTCSG